MRLQDVVLPEPPARRFQQDSLPQGAALAAHPVAEALPPERYPVEAVPSGVLGVSDALPDARLLPAPQPALPPGAAERRAVVPLPVPQQVVQAQRERPEPQAWRAMVSQEVQLVSPEWPPVSGALRESEPQGAAQSSLSPRQSSPPPPLLPPPRGPENASAPVPRARCRSSSSAFSFP